ncbi:capsule assembly Wzi family protein [uncultured Lutibacter sp.]|uniref:capsule assembly Wzi family protein n=1 Tax=uncultured Lutibacter sp. TaxID=437739 RepID=UPI00261768B4|nr:capsule assembly Wzi family protein [uncultured Lutibacter sp.]
MKISLFKRLFNLSIILCVISQLQAQNYSIELNSNVSAKESLPFFLRANKFGAIPNSNNILLNTAIFSDFKNSGQLIDFSYKASITGYVADKNDVFINELYGSFLINNIQVDLGSKNDNIQFEGLSVSNGNIIKSINARTYPGINIKTKNYITLPFAKKWLSAKVNYAEYFLNDKRVVDNAGLHHKSLYLKSVLNSKLELIIGLDHYVQWRGTSEEFGKQPSSFKDYLKIISGSEGGESSNSGEQVNALGNHVGNYLVQLNHMGKQLNWNFYLSHPFEDASGRELSNYPDALYGLFFDLKKPNSIISHVLFEYQHTKHQGRATSPNKLSDNYFNNTIYQSGWTYFGNTIGSPFFVPKDPVNGITNGIAQSRFSSFNLGLKGVLTTNIQYKTSITFTNYVGWFNEDFSENQFSPYLELFYKNNKIPFDISVGTAADFGDFLPTNVGGFIKLTKTGAF